MAIVFAMNSNHNNYGCFKEDCNISYSHQNDHEQPITLSKAYDKLNNYKFNLDYYKTSNAQSQTSGELSGIQHSFLQESDTGSVDTDSFDNKASFDGNDEDHSTQLHKEGASHTQTDTERTRNTEINSGGRNTITCYKCGMEKHIAPQYTHTTKIDGTPIISNAASDDARETGVTLITNNNWHKFKGDPEGYGWAFSQPTTQFPLTATKTSKTDNIQAKKQRYSTKYKVD